MALNDFDIDDVRWLLSGAADPYLDRAASFEGELVQLTNHLRSELTLSRTHLVLKQIELRRRAREKFSRASRMFFTPQLLEQATDERIAQYKASRSPTGSRIWDVCCGIGGDLIGWASRGPSCGVDRNPIATLMAEANCRAYDRETFQAITADANSVDLSECDGWHLDPDRRSGGVRTSKVEFGDPGVEQIDQLLHRQPNAAIKLAAAAAVPEHWLKQAEREWIGTRRECKQQMLWFGAFAGSPGLRRATIVGRDEVPASIVGNNDEPVPVTDQIEQYVFDPHAVVFAAGLSNVLCRQHGLAAIGSESGYLTGDQPIASSHFATFQVETVLAFDVKRVRELLQHSDVGQLEIKVRGSNLDPARLLRELKPKGTRSRTLLITGPGPQVRAVLARRITAED